MKPDEDHKGYYNENPDGNHDQPSRRTLELFSELERRTDEKIDRETKALSLKVEDKMDKTIFWTVYTIQLTIIIGLVGWLAKGISEININLQTTREKVVEIGVKQENTKEILSDIGVQLKDFELISE